MNQMAIEDNNPFQFLDNTPKIRVIIRKRPMNKRESQKSELDIIECRGVQTVIVRETKTKVDLTKYIEEHNFNFDRAFDETASNQQIYSETVRPLIDALFNRAKVTCFAYGQTGSGKTFTMMGDQGGDNRDIQTPIPGLYLLAAQDIFNILESANEFKHFGVYLSFYEIYCGKLHDLLNDRAQLQAREDAKQNVNIVGLSERRVMNVHSLMQIIDFGNAVRTTGSTSANMDSSRSHAILQIALKEGNSNKIYGKMSFIDLAGSERGADVAETNKQTRIDGAEINKSLLALKECIRALDQDKKHTPFRGSKLTLVLKDSFSGNCKTVMIGAISPCASSCEHTLNTLRYADRVKELKKPPGEQNSNLTQLDLLAQQLMLPRQNKNATKIMLNPDAQNNGYSQVANPGPNLNYNNGVVNNHNYNSLMGNNNNNFNPLNYQQNQHSQFPNSNPKDPKSKFSMPVFNSNQSQQQQIQPQNLYNQINFGYGQHQPQQPQSQVQFPNYNSHVNQLNMNSNMQNQLNQLYQQPTQVQLQQPTQNTKPIQFQKRGISPIQNLVQPQPYPQESLFDLDNRMTNDVQPVLNNNNNNNNPSNLMRDVANVTSNNPIGSKQQQQLGFQPGLTKANTIATNGTFQNPIQNMPNLGNTNQNVQQNLYLNQNNLWNKENCNIAALNHGSTQEFIQNFKAKSEEDLQILNQKHEQLINVILAEEEEVISSHRQHIDDMVDLIKQEMVLLNDVDKPASDIDEYVDSLDAILGHKLELISLLRTKLTRFRDHLKEEELLSKKFYEQRSEVMDIFDLNGNGENFKNEDMQLLDDLHKVMSQRVGD